MRYLIIIMLIGLIGCSPRVEQEKTCIDGVSYHVVVSGMPFIGTMMGLAVAYNKDGSIQLCEGK